jgi:phosphate uptake regulator
MKRNIVKHGPSTLTISLPAKWVKENNLHGGANIDVEEKGSQLIINSKKEDDFAKLSVDIENNYRTGIRYINCSYRKGCDELILYYDDSEYIKKIEKCLSEEVLGFEIIKQGKDLGKNFCIIRDIPGTKFEEFDTVFERIWIILISMSEDLIAAIQKNDKKSLDIFFNIDKRMNKFTNFCIRVLSKRSHPMYKNIPIYYRFLRCLEELADYYKNLALEISEKNIKPSKKFLDILISIEESLKLLYKSFYKFSDENIEKILEDTKSRISIIENNQNNKNDVLINNFLSSINTKIRNMTSAIIEMKVLN